jgi:PKD repeat protein
MKVSCRLLVSSLMAIALIAAAIASILLAADVTMANAQQQQQSTSQPSTIERGTAATTRSTKDSFRVQVPQGWVIHDVKNTGSALVVEVLEGFGILAQLCPEEQQQVAQQLTNAGSANTSSSNNSSSTSINNNSCQGAQEVVHVVRYPNLGARLGLTSDDIFAIINRDTIPNAILAYQVQKLQEVGYRNIQIVNSTDTTIPVDIGTGFSNAIASSSTTTEVPAKLVAMTYSTNLAPDETRIGYFILTATAATPRNLGMITGYSIFYEGNSVAETVPSASLAPTPFPAPARQVFDSFELIAAPADPLTVEITSSDTEGVAPATFEFEATIAGGTEPYTISWNFDDGSEESDDDETVDHTFDVADTYTVTVTVTDSTGRTVSDSILITVEAPPPLTAVEITSNDTEGVAPATFEFEANVTGGTEPYDYSWDFGDGSEESDDDETVDHTFVVAGTYNVDLTVTDSTGRTVSDSILITVEAPPPSPPPSPPPIEEPGPGPTVDEDNTAEEGTFDEGVSVGGTSPADDLDAGDDDGA